MNADSLLKRLSNGERWGFRTIPDSPDYFGWVLVFKRTPPVIYPYHASQSIERHERLVKEAIELKARPFHVSVLELNRAVHESGVYESTEDYRVRDNHYFATLEEVLSFFDSQHLKLEDIKSGFDIDAP